MSTNNWCINADAPGWLAKAAAGVGARFLHLSTDYVFDGAVARPYLESDAVAPLNAYGCAKLAGEQAVAEQRPRHLIVRTSWLFGARVGILFAACSSWRQLALIYTLLTIRLAGRLRLMNWLPFCCLCSKKAMSPDFNEWGIYHCSGKPALSGINLRWQFLPSCRGEGIRLPECRRLARKIMVRLPSGH